MPHKHICSITWGCELATDDKVDETNQFLRSMLADAMSRDSLGQQNFFSKLCQHYKMMKHDREMEKEVVWMGETGAIGCAVVGGSILAFTPLAPLPTLAGVCVKVAGLCAIGSAGVAAGVGEAHHGSAMRVHDLELTCGECIQLLAGEEFLKKLDEVETNDQFRSLLRTQEIPFEENIAIGPSTTIVGTFRGRSIFGEVMQNLMEALGINGQEGGGTTR